MLTHNWVEESPVLDVSIQYSIQYRKHIAKVSGPKRNVCPPPGQSVSLVQHTV